MTRPTWDDVWMEAARTVGKRSRCTRGQIGCVLVSADNRVVSVSYVGPPPNFTAAELRGTTCRSWCDRSTATELDPGYRDCVSSHAEQNAVARADFSQLAGGTAYVNGTVCWSCAKLLAASGVGTVVMEVHPGDSHRLPENSVHFLNACGVEVVVMEVK